jgi:hypothetical protein
MTAPDPWATAEKATTTKTKPAEDTSSLADSYNKPSGLFAETGDGVGPSLLNKTHPVGTERTGIIARPPFDRQSTTVRGEPKFWPPKGMGNKPTTEPRDAATGERNRPVMDTVIVLDTDYTMDATEAAALSREEPFEGGRRSYIVSSKEDKEKIKAAIMDAVNRGVSITGDADMVGKRFTVKRIATRPNPNGGDPIKIHEFRIDAK